MTASATDLGRDGHHAVTMLDMRWMTRDAACRGETIFFDFNADPAKAICVNCPLLDACREHGIKYELDGVWGGMSLTERKRARRQRGITLNHESGRMFRV